MGGRDVYAGATTQSRGSAAAFAKRAVPFGVRDALCWTCTKAIIPITISHFQSTCIHTNTSFPLIFRNNHKQEGWGGGGIGTRCPFEIPSAASLALSMHNTRLFSDTRSCVSRVWGGRGRAARAGAPVGVDEGAGDFPHDVVEARAQAAAGDDGGHDLGGVEENLTPGPGAHPLVVGDALFVDPLGIDEDRLDEGLVLATEVVVDWPRFGQQGVLVGLRFRVPGRNIVDPHRLHADAQLLRFVCSPDIFQGNLCFTLRSRLRIIASSSKNTTNRSNCAFWCSKEWG